MPALPPKRLEFPLLTNDFPQMKLLSRGKVRDTYDMGNGMLVQVASDAISIFDFVLNAQVPYKGAVLTALTHFFADLLLRNNLPTHVVGSWADAPAHVRGSALVVRKLTMHPIEFIARQCLTGTGLKAYKKDGMVCGYPLPAGLQDGDKISLLATPTTKAIDGHDEHLAGEPVAQKYPEATALLLKSFAVVAQYLRTQGILLADTKLEVGTDGNKDIIGDELFTPDSSRFWNFREWEEGRKEVSRKAPSSMDKEGVRNWGKTVEHPFSGTPGLQDLDPKNPEHVKFVHALEVPSDVVAWASQMYRYVFFCITGMTLEGYQHQYFHSPRRSLSPKKVEVVVGSESDITEDVARGLSLFEQVRVHVMSCHRNPDRLYNFASDVSCDVIIAGAGKAAALPGVLDAFLRARQKKIPVVGVAFGDPKTESGKAAIASIAQLPGTPVVMRPDGTPFSGEDGFYEACNQVVWGELPPWKKMALKDPQMNLSKDRIADLVKKNTK